MADLLAAAATQIKYAANTTGDAALGHIIKAQGYLARAAAPLAPAPDGPADPTPNWSGTVAEAWTRFLDAADKELIAQGKPAGRDGAERGSLSRDENMKIATDLGVLDELIAGSGGVNPFGPEPEPGTIA